MFVSTAFMHLVPAESGRFRWQGIGLHPFYGIPQNPCSLLGSTHNRRHDKSARLHRQKHLCSFWKIEWRLGNKTAVFKNGSHKFGHDSLSHFQYCVIVSDRQVGAAGAMGAGIEPELMAE